MAIFSKFRLNNGTVHDIAAMYDVNGDIIRYKHGELHTVSYNKRNDIDALMTGTLFCNRLSSNNNVIYEVSSDSGETWEELNVTTEQHKKLFNGDIISPNVLSIPKTQSLRITIDAYDYVYLTSFFLYASSNGAMFNVSLERISHKNEIWEKFSEKYNVTLGWPGVTMVDTEPFIFRTSDFYRIRLTLIVVSDSSPSYPNYQIGKIRYYGTYPYGEKRDYVVDENLKHKFSGAVEATSFIVKNGSPSKFLKADGSVDSNSYQISRIVSQIRQIAVADNEHYPSEKCVAMIIDALQSDIDDVASVVNNKEDNTNKVSTLDNSDTHYPSAKAVKAAVDGICDSLSALVQLVQTKEVLVNKVTSISAQSTDAQYPSAKAVFTALQNIQTNVYGTDAAINDVYISPSKRELQLTAGNKGGTIVYYELNQTANEYYLNVINASSMFHGGHSIVLENKTGYSTFITIDDNSFFGIPVVIRQYGNGIDKPAINLSNNQSIKIDYITNGSCVILTASYI